tara:strand:- start:6517 stop:7113 length:597 start_codon:yes stop_codon:yes gene_type:complete
MENTTFLRNLINSFYRVTIFFIIALFLQSCGGFKRADVKDVPINDADKRKKNIEEGRGITFGTGKKRSGTFDFATSNEMWRASLEILDFVPLATVDYSGGVIITDWYSDDLNSNETIKIIVNFLSNEIRADGLKIKIYKKFCNENQKCKTQPLNSKINTEIKLAILKKAAQLKKFDQKKASEEKGSYMGINTTRKDSN